MLTSRKKLLSLVLPVCLMIGTLASLVFFWERYEHHHRQKNEVTEDCGFPCYIGKRLHLNKVQSDSIAIIDGINRIKIHQQLEEVTQAKLGMVSVLGQPLQDSSLRGVLNNIAIQQIRLDSLSFNNFKQMRSVCTEAQKTEFDMLIKEIIGKWGRRK